MTSEDASVINPKQFLEGRAAELENLALYAKASTNSPVVVLVDGNSPWATATKVLLSAMSIEPDMQSPDGFLKGCGSWDICEIAAKSAPTIAEHLLEAPKESTEVRIVMFYQTPTGLRIACTDISLAEYPYH
ncbi:hypothetical protein A3I99_02665 [Candidatus Kaiserbacteria bacterium RIFCSPLOWO2_02_FULL_45_11b]|uniref:Uncharacterized protein n=1 Tax=Candidatus Kaiserbacteria bacterium RIFCSPLOWO2_12_FULL_45_26 TaxID=1798525 RepID=A0A1F6FFA6_9BACT|nr:MAG: hypothetical protein A2Z56_01855 [Candidatus Kaiserbacteria bacterium RIFCSPHIGHO2_12_45_16]OGG70285.1 MAG: hypothetical protein A2929_04410 [Candidatus Kaiserbacteria bacterium RIFCSPLOWO2_01_FULL_45_25]OGG81953.1 MAG: hypothetical protein A3I99_02665 [Candidatus Kaiserbacteria bacterium RIFCSPLOWO2_02_FULL_45_11b]OGG84549.1 MAG: hypothetical protein A3G90_00455 [Candidatus Kaiserbacteria bacterium RIFCSPLOWO2_12_FULL_45_26]